VQIVQPRVWRTVRSINEPRGSLPVTGNPATADRSWRRARDPPEMFDLTVFLSPEPF
jgi:hypothetical protein